MPLTADDLRCLRALDRGLDSPPVCSQRTLDRLVRLGLIERVSRWHLPGFPLVSSYRLTAAGYRMLASTPH